MTQRLVHPYTGLTAIGLRRDGRPIYPIRGGSKPTPTPAPPPGDPAPTPAPTPPPAPADPTRSDDEPLGPGGKAALTAEREARKALEKQLAELAPLKKLAEAIGGGQQQDGGKSEVEILNEKFAAYEKDLAEERTARWRAEVAADKGLTPGQAKRLQGSTREELAADADEILRDFPVNSGGEQRRVSPRPDLSQGSRGGAGSAGREAALAEAKKRFGDKSTVT